jgi:hypothetical protein
LLKSVNKEKKWEENKAKLERRQKMRDGES